MNIQTLVKMSNYYGNDPEIVLLGGGNTSQKNNDFMFVKPSGASLKTITDTDFVKVNRTRLATIWSKQYSTDDAAREAEVLADLMNAAETDGLRPSVETLLHDLFPQKYVVHTHPTLVNALTCAKEGRKWAQKLFGVNVLWMPASIPGYVLAKEVKDLLLKNRTENGEMIQIVFMENHGVFVSADNENEIREQMDFILQTIKNKINFINSNDKINYLLSLGKDKFFKEHGFYTPDHYVYRADWELFQNSVKIAVYSESFGGGKPMPDWLTDFIVNWEVESYRKSITP